MKAFVQEVDVISKEMGVDDPTEEAK